MNPINFDNIPSDAAEALKKNGIDAEALKGAGAQKLLSSLNRQDAEKINQLLSDKEALNQLLNSDKARQLMSRLFGNNGAK